MIHSDLRQRLLRAAEQEIMANGLARASLRSIARRVGVSHQATAHHFDDRAGLFTALAVEGFETLCTRTRARMAEYAEPGGQQVAQVALVYVEFAQRHPTMFDVMFRPELLHATDDTLLAARETHRNLMVEALEAARATGWGFDVDTVELATIGWATVHGLAVLQRDAQFADAPTEVDVARLLERISSALEGP